MIVGPVPTGVGWHKTRDGQDEQIASLRTRLVAERDRPDPEFWADAVYFVYHMLEGQVEPVEPLSINEWLARFGGPTCSKVKQLRAAWQVACNREEIAKLCTKYQVLMKAEIKACMVLSADDIKTRLVITIPNLMKALLGRWLVAESRFCHTVFGPEADFGFAYGPGASMEAQAAWLIRAYQHIPYLIECDFSKFDMTNSPLSALVPLLIHKMFGMSSRVWEAHAATTKPGTYKCSDGVVAHVDRPGTCTGHPGTTFDNTWKSMVAISCAIVLSWGRRHHPGEALPELLDRPDCPRWTRDFWLMNTGDDTIGVIRPELVPGMADELKRSGYKAKLKTGHDLPAATFCSNCLWPVENGKYCFGPMWKVLLKLGVTVTRGMELVDVREMHGRALVMALKRNTRAHKRMLSFRRGVAYGLLKATAYVPLLCDKIQSELATTSGVPIDQKYKALGLKAFQASDWHKYVLETSHVLNLQEAYEWASRRYAVPVGVILNYASELRNMAHNVPGVVGSSTAWDVLRPAIALTDDIS